MLAFSNIYFFVLLKRMDLISRKLQSYKFHPDNYDYIAIGAFILGCDSYPSILKSSNL
jgi:hypothetical protein